MTTTTKDNGNATAATETRLALPDSTAIIERVLLAGDLAKLTPNDRMNYYRAVCESVGLNPLTRPFEYITLNNKLTLYARKDCTDQLRKIHRVSITIVSRDFVHDLYVVTARATTPDGRQDEEIGAVNVSNLRGEALCNAMMKASTKSKRRVTLSICGLGMLDETEVESIAPQDKQPFVEPQQSEDADAAFIAAKDAAFRECGWSDIEQGTVERDIIAKRCKGGSLLDLTPAQRQKFIASIKDGTLKKPKAPNHDAPADDMADDTVFSEALETAFDAAGWPDAPGAHRENYTRDALATVSKRLGKKLTKLEELPVADRNGLVLSISTGSAVPGDWGGKKQKVKA